MSQLQSNYHPKPKFDGTKTGIFIQPCEIVQFFRGVHIGQTVDIKRGCFIGKSFKVVGKNISAEGNYLIVDAESEKFTPRAAFLKPNICSQCKRDVEVACSCLPLIQKFN